VRAIADWSALARDAEAPLPPARPLRLPAEARGAWSEAVCRDLMTEAGIPVVPGVVANTPTAAGAAAAAYGVPVALKVVSADVLHKSDVGGVELQVAPAEAEQAAAMLLRRVATAVPAALVDGVLVSPMRSDGLDLLVGVVREPGWGNVLAVGLGGLWAEAMQDVQRIALPASERQIERGLRRLKAWPLFEGARSSDRIDIPALVQVIARIADLSLGLGDQLAALEVNPLRVTPAGAEALDAVVVWRE